MSAQLLFSLAAILVIVGFLIALIAVVLMFPITVRGKGKVKGGGAGIIEPFPVIFGTDRESLGLLLLSIALILLVLIATVMYARIYFCS